MPIMAGREIRLLSQTMRAIRLAVATLLTALMVSIMGCFYFPESSFELSKDSRPPKWIALPTGNAHSDTHLTMSYSSVPLGNNVLFELKSKNNQTVEKVYGKTLCKAFSLSEPAQGFTHAYPAFEPVSANGMTEMIEHKKMEPVFYVTDDSAVWKHALEIGCVKSIGGNQ